MNSQGDMIRKSNIIIYTTEDGLAKIDTTFDGDTVWLSIDQMAELFQRDRSVIGKHVTVSYTHLDVYKRQPQWWPYLTIKVYWK